MRLILLLCISLLGFTSLSGANPEPKTIKVTCEMSFCNEVLKIYRFNGLGFVEVKTAEVSADKKNYTFSLPASETVFYYIGQRPDRTVPVLLGEEKEITIQGTCRDIRKIKINNSKINIIQKKLE